ncbi:MAG: glycosyltransferase family 4 protein [Vicinamibacteria bacterium]
MTEAKVSRPIRLAALVPYPVGTTPSQRFRIEQWRPYLAARGIETDFLPFASPRLNALLYQDRGTLRKALALSLATARRVLDVARGRHYDAIFLHRALCLAGPALLERALSRFRAPVVYDFDDAIYLLHTSRANRVFGWLKFPSKTATICGLADHVVVANATLSSWAREYAARVSVIPSSVDTARFRPRGLPRREGPIRVGWTGSHTSLEHLEARTPLLARLVDRLGVELHVHTDRRPELPGVRHEWHRWTPDNEVEVLSLFDIGIMPMPDDPWSRGKSAMKALLYMSMGIPTIASAVGTNRDAIENDADGLLVDDDGWDEAVARLVGDPVLRLRLGEAGRRRIEESYSMSVCAGRLEEVIRSEMRRKASRA